MEMNSAGKLLDFASQSLTELTIRLSGGCPRFFGTRSTVLLYDPQGEKSPDVKFASTRLNIAPFVRVINIPLWPTLRFFRRRKLALAAATVASRL